MGIVPSQEKGPMLICWFPDPANTTSKPASISASNVSGSSVFYAECKQGWSACWQKQTSSVCPRELVAIRSKHGRFSGPKPMHRRRAWLFSEPKISRALVFLPNLTNQPLLTSCFLVHCELCNAASLKTMSFEHLVQNMI